MRVVKMVSSEVLFVWFAYVFLIFMLLFMIGLFQLWQSVSLIAFCFMLFVIGVWYNVTHSERGF
ncbi:MAG: hypothetical protein AM326_08190 [Candidatus Thorarchaeota archaeon SMTZ-45]|nr:MAG: hypothetical protein AM326_08190 [Candidatus Thorarchaeota archaeon SMTZ-45]